MSRTFKKRSPRRAAKASPALPPVDVTAERLGAQGDAVAAGPDGPLFIPFALPGERLRVRPGERRGEGRVAAIEDILEPSTDRVTPPCPHFGTCGGCALQHMAAPAEAAWKRAMVIEALGQRGFAAPPVAETISLPAGSRRRAVLGFRRTADGLILGFKARQTHTLLNVTACPVLVPEIVGALPGLKAALAQVVPPGGAGDLMVVAVDDGLDVRLDLPQPPDLAAREALAAVAEDLDLARLVLRIDDRDEPVAIRRQPTLRLGDVRVGLPSGAFLQPSVAGERVLIDLVRQGLEGVSGPVVDLFCGLGTFALPLSRDHAVSGFDADPALIGALAVPHRVRAVVRDLFRLPLMEKELAGYAAAVIDPPRAGARAQAETLADDGPPRIVAVSCNPATFARDARILCDGGYRLTRVTPVDQFVWSSHMELVAVFERNG